MKLSDFDYNLPKEFIAQKPVSPRDYSKLMIVNDKIEHKNLQKIGHHKKMNHWDSMFSDGSE